MRAASVIGAPSLPASSTSTPSRRPARQRLIQRAPRRGARLARDGESGQVLSGKASPRRRERGDAALVGPDDGSGEIGDDEEIGALLDQGTEPGVG